jgi:hypothetical protein
LAGSRNFLRRFELELHLDSPDGKLLGKGRVDIPKKEEKKGSIKISIQAITDSKTS